MTSIQGLLLKGGTIGSSGIDLSDGSFVTIFTGKSAAKRKSVSREDI